MKKWMRIGRALLAIALVLLLQVVIGLILIQLIKFNNKVLNFNYFLQCVAGVSMTVATTYVGARFYFNYVKDSYIRELYILYTMYHQGLLTIAAYIPDIMDIWLKHKSQGGAHVGIYIAMTYMGYKQLKALASQKVKEYEKKIALPLEASPQC